MRIVACVLTCLAGVGLFCGADWLQFRGTDSNSVASSESLPTTWDPASGAHVAWKVELPGRGVSSPIVVKGKVIVTSVTGYLQDRLHVVCVDAASGTKSWERQFWATGRTFCHPTSSVAAPTPASDGERIFAFYSSNDLVCLDLDGNLLWYRGLAHDYPAAGNDVGMASSALVVGDTVVVQVESQGDSFVAGLDTDTGDTRWKHPRERTANWSSPAVMRGPTREEDAVLIQSPSGLTSHRPRTGEQLWSYEATCDNITSPVAVGDVVYVPLNRGSALTAVKKEGDSQSPEVLWTSNDLGPSRVCPLVQDGRVYVISGGVLACGDAASGEVHWRERIDGSYWGTPLLAGGHIYAISEDGVARVIEVGDKRAGEVSKIELGEPVLASPAAADGALYIRGDKHLWKIAD